MTVLDSLILEFMADFDAADAAFDSAVSRYVDKSKKLEQKINTSLGNSLHLKPTVDHKPLDELNKHLELKRTHTKDIQKSWDANPLAVRVDTKALTDFKVQLSSVQQILGTLKTPKLNVKFGEEKKSSRKVTRAVEKASRRQSSDARKTHSLLRRLGKRLTSKATKSLGFTGTVAALGTAQVLAPLFSGITSGLEQSLLSSVGSLDFLGEKITIEVAKGLRSGIRAAKTELDFSLDEAKLDHVKATIDEGLTEISQTLNLGLDSLFGSTERKLSAQAAKTRSDQRRLQRRDEGRQGSVLNRRAAIKEHRDAVEGSAFASNRVKTQEKLVEKVRERQIKAGEKFSTIDLTKPGADKAIARADKELEALDNILRRQEAKLEAYKTAERLATARLADARKFMETSATLLKEFAPEAIPEAYKKLLIETIGKLPDEDIIPNLKVNDKLLKRRKSNATFSAETNTINISSDLDRAIKAGDLTQKQVETLVHEIQHWVQSSAGSFEGIVALIRGESTAGRINATAEEIQQLGRFLEQYRPQDRENELEAEVVAQRLGPKIFSRIQSECPIFTTSPPKWQLTSPPLAKKILAS